MHFTDLGLFTTYEPDGENPKGIIYFRNEAGRDFYDLVREIDGPAHWFMADRNGTVVAATDDLSALAPFDARIIQVGDGADLAADHVRRAETGDPDNRLIWDGTMIRPYLPSHAEFRAQALARLNAVHARLLRVDGATDEERRTWPTKRAAAEAVIDGSATDAQAALLAEEAGGGDAEMRDLAQVILYKAAAQDVLIGAAGRIRKAAKAAIHAATAETEPREQIAAVLTGLHVELEARAREVAAQWQADAMKDVAE